MKRTVRQAWGLGVAASLAVISPSVANAQCETWVNPSATTGWIDFNNVFGGAPCDDGSGCPFNEITDFQIWADEAYAMDNVAQGGSYTFSACNGVGGAAWNIEFTVIAPSGAVDASGLDAGSVCEITWTASEAGSYLIVVSEAGACGTSLNQDVDNGFPAITCVSSPATQCGAGPVGCTTWVNPSATAGWTDFNTTFGGAPCDDGTGCPFNEITAFQVWADEAYAMDNCVAGGTYTFSACNGAGGSAWPLQFTIVAPSGAVDASGLDAGSTCELTWTCSESGTYLIVVSEDGACGVSLNQDVDNGFPAITCVSSPATQCGTEPTGCTTWVNPSATTGWSDFNTTFGGAPCDDGTGCPFNEITAFQVWADEAYAMDNCVAGGTYTFSACNGAGGSAWPLQFTIVAPSGAVDASGLDAGSTCELTWTCSESGTYLIVVSEDGACGVSLNQDVDNGFPAITCVSSPETQCGPPSGCTTWVNPSATTGWVDFNNNFGGAPCDDGTGCPFNEIIDFQIWADEAYAMDNCAQGGTYTFSACNGAGGSAWPIQFTIIAPSGAVDATGLDAGSTCELTWTCSESGTYLIVVSEEGACGISTNQDVDNGFPAITCVSSPETECLGTNIARATTISAAIFPNPNTGAFTLALPSGLIGTVAVEVLDLRGRAVWSNTVNVASNTNIDLTGTTPGTYYVRVTTANEVIKEKLVILGR